MGTVETVGHWWNGRWGRLARRDVWLKRDTATGQWWAEARQGDGDSKVWRSKPGSEDVAREELTMLQLRGSTDWRDLSGL